MTQHGTLSKTKEKRTACFLWSDSFPGKWRSYFLLSAKISLPGTQLFHLPKPSLFTQPPTSSHMMKDLLSFISCSLLWNFFPATHILSHLHSQAGAEARCSGAPGNVSTFLHKAALQIFEDAFPILPKPSFLQAKYPQDRINSKFLSSCAIQLH